MIAMDGRHDTTDIHALLAQCRSHELEEQYAAIRALERAGDTRADVIIELVMLAGGPKDAGKPEDDRVREAAIRALGVLTPPELHWMVVHLLIQWSCSDDSSLRNQAVQSLGMIGDPESHWRLERVLRHDPDWVVRASAAEALGELGNAAASSTLMDAAREDAYYPVRTYAIASIAKLGGAATLPFLRERLAVEAHPQTRNELVEHALRFGDRAAFDELLELLATDDWDMGMFPVDSVERLLSDGPPAILRERADELDRALADLAERVGGHEEWHGVTAYIDDVRARVRAQR